MCAIMLAAAMTSSTACSTAETTTGTAGSFVRTSGIVEGEFENIAEVIVTLDSGEEVRALIPDKIEYLESGQTLQLEKVTVDGEERWQVKKVLAEP
jgi:hypothetical protein